MPKSTVKSQRAAAWLAHVAKRHGFRPTASKFPQVMKHDVGIRVGQDYFSSDTDQSIYRNTTSAQFFCMSGWHEPGWYHMPVADRVLATFYTAVANGGCGKGGNWCNCGRHMSRRSELRAAVIERSGGRCEWSRCTSPGEQLAHIRGLALGGNPDGTRDVIGNVMWACLFHHHMLDGRIRMKLWEVESLLIEIIAHRYSYGR